jgi:predicted NAD/FAD-binding protein
MVYHHPVFHAGRYTAQRRHRELIDYRGISYCGAYWGHGFHEDGVNSGLAVASVLCDPRRRTERWSEEPSWHSTAGPASPGTQAVGA